MPLLVRDDSEANIVAIPTSPQVEKQKSRKEFTHRVSCVEGACIFTALATLLGVLMASVIYLGFWAHLYDDDDLILVLSGGSNDAQQLTTSTSLTGLNVLTGSCSRLPHLPEAISAATGAIHDKKVCLCGGKDDRNNTKKECYEMLRHSWEPFGTLIVPRAHSASVRLPSKGWWITGGEREYPNGSGSGQFRQVELQDTTEILDHQRGMPFELGPNLREPVSRHCLVRINNTQVMLIGGRTPTTNYSKLAWFFDFQGRGVGGRKWVSRGQLLQGRHSHVCARLAEGGRVLVAGGATEGQTIFGTDSVESFDPLNGGWVTLTSLPGPMLGGSVFFWRKAPTLVGGSHTKRLIQWRDEEPNWIKLEKEMGEILRYAVTVPTRLTWVCW